MPEQSHFLFKQGCVAFDKKHWNVAADYFLKAHALAPNDIEILEALASTTAILGDVVKAQQYFEKAITLSEPSPSIQLLSNCAHLLQHVGLEEQAKQKFKKIISQAPDYSQAWINLGSCYVMLKQMKKAVECYEKVRKLEPDNYAVLNGMSYCYHTLCMWDKADEIDRLLFALTDQEIKAGKVSLVDSFAALFLKTSAASLKVIATNRSEQIAVKQKAQSIALQQVKKARKHSRIRIGYFSVALVNHATTQLIQDMFSHHDADKFEVFIYAINVAGPCDMYNKIKQAAEHIYELNSMDDLECAQLIQSHELDVLIDLDGVIKDNKQSVLSLKPAPVQIAWLGYAGTSGAPWIDYILADNVVIPNEQEPNFSEKVLRHDGCYQFNGFSSQQIEPVNRKRWGLPSDKFIFASFNVSRKFDRDTFEAWCLILKHVENSILWLLIDDDDCYEVLSCEMERAGVSANRLVRAYRTDRESHLSRFTAADLFLDSFICNAHTTCTEALAAGLPVLTCAGQTFASRVAASILTAAQMPNCITYQPIEYVKRAIEIAENPAEHKRLKDHLRDKSSIPLFDQKAWVKNWESLLIRTLKSEK